MMDNGKDSRDGHKSGLETRLKEAFGQVHAAEDVKEHTRAYLAQAGKKQKADRGRKARQRLVTAAASLMVLAGSGHWIYFTPAAEISIDSNPSMELGINRFDRVISVGSCNGDGQELADSLDIRFADYRQAMTQILENDQVEMLLSEDEFLTITVTGADSMRCGRILAEVEACTGKRKNLGCYYAQPEEISAAHELGLSYGKYVAYLELQALDPTVSLQEVQGLTMRELRDRIQSLSGLEPLPRGNGSGKGRGSGEGNGQGRKQ